MKTLAAIGKYYIALSAVGFLLMTVFWMVYVVVIIFVPSWRPDIGLGVIALPLLFLIYGLTGALGITTLLVLRKIKQNPILIAVLLVVGLLAFFSQSYASLFADIGYLVGWVIQRILPMEFYFLISGIDLRGTNYYFIVILLPYLLFVFFAFCIFVQNRRSKNAVSGESTTDVAK